MNWNEILSTIYLVSVGYIDFIYPITTKSFREDHWRVISTNETLCSDANKGTIIKANLLTLLIVKIKYYIVSYCNTTVILSLKFTSKHFAVQRGMLRISVDDVAYKYQNRQTAAVLYYRLYVGFPRFMQSIMVQTHKEE